MLYFASSLLLVLLVGVASGQPQTGCQPTYDTISGALQALNAPLYPTGQFSKQCLATACSALTSGPCPYLSGSTNKTLNATAVQTNLNTLSSCLQNPNTASLCSTPIQSIPMTCATGITLQALFGVPNITGNITLVPGTGSVTGISSAVLTYDPTSDTFIVTVALVYQGQADGYVGLPNNDNFLHLDNVPITVTLTLGLVLAIDPDNTANQVKVVSSTVSKQAQLGNLFPNATNPQDQNTIQNALTAAFNQTVEGSALPQDVGQFIGIILANACLVAEDNCAM